MGEPLGVEPETPGDLVGLELLVVVVLEDDEGVVDVSRGDEFRIDWISS